MAVIPPIKGQPVPPAQVSPPSRGTIGTPTPGGIESTPADSVKGCLGFVVSLLIAGVLAESLYKVSPKASYMFVAVVLLGYASTGGNIDKVTAFFDSITSVNTITGGGRQR